MFQSTISYPDTDTSTNIHPFPSTIHDIIEAKYKTSTDPTGYIFVFQYPLNGHVLMMNKYDGYILWSALWKAIGNCSVDADETFKMYPFITQAVRNIEDGLSAIQGAWLPYNIARNLALGIAWNIKEDLIPFFGPDFAKNCIAPTPTIPHQLKPSQDRRLRVNRQSKPSAFMYESVLAVPTTQPQTRYRKILPRPPTQTNSSLPFLQPRHGYPAPTVEAVLTLRENAQDMFPSNIQSKGQHNLMLTSSSICASHIGNPSSTSSMSTSSGISVIANEGSAASNRFGCKHCILPPISTFDDLRHIDLMNPAAVLRHLAEDEDLDVGISSYTGLVE
ncbi:transcription regulator HTH, apses-type DNA-binding domain-containing protein [Lentinula edodes]|nr:transcription regulator HTH, apses-type DNA-binding domain-containing protein [Lentinula edodes]